MNSNIFKTYAAVAILIFGFPAVFVLSNFLERNRPPLAETYIDEDLALQGEKLKGWSLGFEGLIADWYWIRSLQYMGHKVATSKEQTINLEDLRSLNPRLLYPLLDNATTLDPQFMAAYSYGAIVLPAIDPRQAIRIAEKGIENNPDEWRLYQHLGYIYWRLKDYDKAAETYEKGSRIEGAPKFFKLMSARMEGEGGSRETARAIYRQMLAEASDANVKANAELRLMQLDAFDERDAITEVLTEYKKKTGRCAESWREILPLLAAAKLPEGKEFRVDRTGDPVDPSGVPYVLDAERCAVRIDTGKSKIPSD
jgi:tetratricopeptide (TPR) repeat protein